MNGPETLVEVQVGPADVRSRHPDDRVGRVLDHRVRDRPRRGRPACRATPLLACRPPPQLRARIGGGLEHLPAVGAFVTPRATGAWRRGWVIRPTPGGRGSTGSRRDRLGHRGSTGRRKCTQPVGWWGVWRSTRLKASEAGHKGSCGGVATVRGGKRRYRTDGSVRAVPCRSAGRRISAPTAGPSRSRGAGTGPVLAGYTILRTLGQGGAAVVYLARQEALDRLVAVKVLRRGVEDERAWRHFRREATTIARLSAHPNVVTVYTAGRSQPVIHTLSPSSSTVGAQRRHRGPRATAARDRGQSRRGGRRRTRGGTRPRDPPPRRQTGERVARSTRPDQAR